MSLLRDVRDFLRSLIGDWVALTSSSVALVVGFLALFVLPGWGARRVFAATSILGFAVASFRFWRSERSLRMKAAELTTALTEAERHLGQARETIQEAVRRNPRVGFGFRGMPIDTVTQHRVIQVWQDTATGDILPFPENPTPPKP